MSAQTLARMGARLCAVCEPAGEGLKVTREEVLPILRPMGLRR